MSLTVYINSFSYLKSQIPNDHTGHGGGFVFDCRYINNPGRQDEFKTKTGRDGDVIEFIQSQTAMGDFLKNVFGIVDPAIENYLHRGFTSLLVNFGCTGGQHRSVYAAETLQKHISEKFPQVDTVLKHVELDKTQA
ncbi:MAG TPA: RNase adapter RapZ [Ignavibacteria bacterium]|nr:RNase adapter RapZ [Ignavibacteria bacterium]